MKPINRIFFAASAGLLALLAGCTTPSLGSQLGYYWQSISGHVQLMQAARLVDDWIADTQTPESLKNRLALSQRIRSFAVSELHLPDNPSYRRFADLRRSAVVWNVVAAPAFSLTLKTWCFPVAGCVGYRGYFAEAEARAEAARLATTGLEVSVYGVPAYSTLGWMNWAGGDPLLSTFIHYPEGELARLIFHELAHQVVYAASDTVFNESFATAVERIGGQRWLQTQADPVARKAYTEFDQRRQQFRALALATRLELADIYKQKEPAGQQTPAQAAMKIIAMQRFKSNYETLKTSWGGFAGYDPWVARANNAAFGAQAAYDELVPAFEALFEQQGRDWPRFYDAVRAIADMPDAKARRAALPGTKS